MDVREYDIMMLEIQMANDELEIQWRIEQLGKRAQRMMQDAGSTEVSANASNEQPPGIASPEPEPTY